MEIFALVETLEQFFPDTWSQSIYGQLSGIYEAIFTTLSKYLIR
ncbi:MULTISPECIES: hypothetical protein [Okeania]|nr:MULTISPECIES: hypothetical protein [Okeania]